MSSLLILLLPYLFVWGAVLTEPFATGQTTHPPGIKEVQIPFASLQPTATFEIGGSADWVLVTEDAVLVGGKKPFSLQRIDPQSN